MAQKYELIYNDVVNIEHELQIFDDSYSGSIIEIQGRVFLDYSKAEDNLEAIRGQGLRVELEADSDLTYSDLYSEEEKTFPVKYIRNSVTLFDGWLNPEGFFENYVKTKWIVSFDCVDGLGYLENLSFVNTDGTFIIGKITQFEAIRLAFLRTGLQKDINISIDIYYTGLSTSVCVLENVFVIAERYIKDDGNTIMSCEEVLRDILEPYGAVVKSYGDAWFIYKPNQLYSNRTQTFYNFDYLGVSGSSFSQEFSQPLGSQEQDYSPHHCSENQSLGIAPSTGAYRISYKYGLVQALLPNIYLYTDDGVTIDDWEIISSSNMHALIQFNSGVTFDTPLTSAGASVENLRNDAILIDSVTALDVYIRYQLTFYSSNVKLNFQILACDDLITAGGVDIYYLQDDISWGAVGVPYTLTSVNEGEIRISCPVPPSAIVGTTYFYVEIWTPERFFGINNPLEVQEISVAVNQTTSDQPTIIGEFHTFQRLTKPSAQVKRIKEVATGDNETDIYLGTIYKADEVTPTSTWFRKDITEAKPILQIMGEETMRMNQLPSRLFSGDVFGYINYLDVISINGIDGSFMILEYSYDTYANIIALVMRQIFGDELTDLDYTQTIDYGNTVRPTIVN